MKQFKKQAEVIMPTEFGDFKMIAYAFDENEKMPDLVLLSSNIQLNEIPLVRIHSECMTGDVFGSKRCDCGLQLKFAMEQTYLNGGIVIYLRQEGRGIGLINKMKAYQLQDKGMNTIDANLHLGFDADNRDYSQAAFILNDLGFKSIKLMTNNPIKVTDLEKNGIEIVERIPIEIKPNEFSQSYLDTKRDIMGHFLSNF